MGAVTAKKVPGYEPASQLQLFACGRHVSALVSFHTSETFRFG